MRPVRRVQFSQVPSLAACFVVIHQVVVAGGDVEAVPEGAVEPVDVLLVRLKESILSLCVCLIATMLLAKLLTIGS